MKKKFWLSAAAAASTPSSSTEKSPDCGEIWCAPGNGGISYDAKCKNIKSTDVDTMVALP